MRPAGHAAAMKGSTLVAVGILISRLFGMVRGYVLAHYFGVGLWADIFTWASKFPNFLQNLLGDGVMSASFIPIYAELVEKKEKEEAGRVAGAVLAVLVAVTTAVAALSILLAPLIVAFFLPTYEGNDRELAIAAARVMFPASGILVWSAWALGVQSAHRRFLMGYLAPVASSLVVIAALGVFGGALGWSGEALLRVAAWATLGGAVVQLAVQLPTVWRLEPALRIRLDTRLAGVRDTFRNAGPTITGRGAGQLSAWLDTYLAMLLTAGAASSIGIAQTLNMLPISLFGMSIVAAELPELARQRDDATGAMRARVNAAIERVLFYVVPSSAAFLALGPVIAGAYRGGQFGDDDAALVGWVLRAYALSLVAATVSRVTSSAFYALRDTTTPSRIAVLRFALSAAAGFVLMLQFEAVWHFPSGIFADWRIGDHRLGAVGLAAGTSLGAWVEWYLLRRALSARIGPVGARITTVVRIGAAALAGAGAGVGATWLVPPLHPIADAAVACAAFGVVYLAAALAFGLEEVTSLLARIRARLARR